MKRVEKCITEDCIPTPSSCIKWNGGDISFLGICDGDSLNPLMDEIIKEIQKAAGKDLSKFDITSLVDICKKESPEEVNLLSILTLLRDNQLCLKDFIDELESQLLILFEGQNVKINLKCYIGLNNLGLSITREQLDQLVIDILCNHKTSLDSADSSILRIQESINEAGRNKTIEEVKVATCINTESLPLSKQVQNTSKELCDYESTIGTATDINNALANTPVDLNAEFGAITGWNAAPTNWAENYGNTLLEVENLRQRLKVIENTCCNVTCADIIVGFTAIFNEDNTGLILKFTKGAGMILPKGFTDCGSTGTITDSLGNTQDFDLVISLGAVVEVTLEGISSLNDLTINIGAIFCNTEKGIQCNKCIQKVVEQAPCQFCTLTATGDVTVHYKICIEDDCTDKVLEMQDGDIFVLPPNATVTTVSDSLLVTNDCEGDLIEFTTTTTTTTSTTTTTTLP